MPRYGEQEARAAIATSLSYSEALRKLGLRPAGGNHMLFRRYVDEVWKISTTHFDQASVQRRSLATRVAVPLSDVLVEGSSYSRRTLKRRLYEVGLKQRQCEMCGQGEVWRDQLMSLILDHINGIPDDNRLENLRILCPNCNATLDTHCGRKNAVTPRTRNCQLCGSQFRPRHPGHMYCSSECGSRHSNRHRKPRPEARKVERPTYDQLLEDLSETSMVKVGRKYGVSDNAVRKWLRWYEAEAARDACDAAADICDA